VPASRDTTPSSAAHHSDTASQSATEDSCGDESPAREGRVPEVPPVDGLPHALPGATTTRLSRVSAGAPPDRSGGLVGQVQWPGRPRGDEDTEVCEAEVPEGQAGGPSWAADPGGAAALERRQSQSAWGEWFCCAVSAQPERVLVSAAFTG